MIRLHRTLTPIDLCPDTVSALTRHFQETGEAVWKKRFIVDFLAEFSHNKCSYCETLLGEESKYLEVEHFHAKDLYPAKVVDWTNLLPACKRCNGAKREHDVLAEPLIDPFRDDPTAHLQLRASRLRAKTQLGLSSIDVVNLNDPDRLVIKRFQVQQMVLDQVDLLSDRVTAFQHLTNARNRNRAVNAARGLLKECLPPAAYAATAATSLLESDFSTLQTHMESCGLWNDEFAEQVSIIHSIALT